METLALRVKESCENAEFLAGFFNEKKLKPDVIFLDVIMPNYDGFYTLNKIREIDADAKIIMVTADFSPSTKKKLKELKANDVIYKPYDGRAIIWFVNYSRW